ncbi:hypothetical protein ES707_11408 [subsurface metagenome]
MATEILRPNAGGDETGCYWYDGVFHSPDPLENFRQVNEAVADEFDSCVANQGNIGWWRDLYNLTNHSVGSGTINRIVVWANCYAVKDVNTNLKLVIKAGTGSGAPTTVQEGSAQTIAAGNWWDKYQIFETNPATGLPFTWAEIDRLQAGVSIRGGEQGESGGTFVTQVSVDVDYTLWEGPYTTVEITAPWSARPGEIVNVSIKVTNIWTDPFEVWSQCAAPDVGDYIIDETEVINNGQYKTYYGHFTMPDYTCKVRAYTYYQSDSSWYPDAYEEQDVAVLLLPPEAPTNVRASDGDYTNCVEITWDKSTGATGYQVYRDGSPLGWLGNVSSYYDYDADEPTIDPGNAVASDGTYVDYVHLYLLGEGIDTHAHTYIVKARNDEGESGYSSSNNGYLL